MVPVILGRRWLICATAIAVASIVPANGQESTDSRPINVAREAHRFIAEVLDPQAPRPRLPLTSDTEHARSIDPVLTKGAAIWIHEALPSPPLTVMGGMVFAYSDHIYDPIEAPVLKIRPIDDDQNIPFLARAVARLDGDDATDASVTVSFPAPLIFDAHIDRISAWVGEDPAPVVIERSRNNLYLEASIRVTPPDGPRKRGSARSATVFLEGELVLGSYRVIPAGRFSESETTTLEPDFAHLAQIQIGRDVEVSLDEETLRGVAESITSNSRRPFDRVVALTNWVSNQLQYEESAATRSAVEALNDRRGDCDEHSTLTAGLLRSVGIPVRRANGFIYNFDDYAGHAWLEVGLPTRDGRLHWFVVDPTFAGTTPLANEKAAYIQFKDRVLLYPIKPRVTVKGGVGVRSADIMLNWRKADGRPLSNPSLINQFIDLVTTSIDRKVAAGAERIEETDLALIRESASIAGSSYLIIDRPLEVKGADRIQLRLKNEERLTLDILVSEGSDPDSEAISRLRSAYQDLSFRFFSGDPAYRNLELIYVRDRHSDQLQTVSLRVGRYLVENFLDRILKRLVKGGLLSEGESERLSAVSEASGGRNLYLIQELAFRQCALRKR
jgi:transglutaminase-like putative cysteine protease